MSAASTETSTPLPAAGSRVFFQPAPVVGCAGPVPITGDDPVQKKQGKVTVKYDRKELRKRLVLEEWIIEQLSELYDCEDTKSPSKYPEPMVSLFPYKARSVSFNVVYMLDTHDFDTPLSAKKRDECFRDVGREKSLRLLRTSPLFPSIFCIIEHV
ncbi:hypothetical protein LDENG_00010990 [Lucifuga dentata]|nr:hypothetical protein LDENG_00010990 [Lucifuga dentata]